MAKFSLSCRYILAISGFLGLTNVYFSRINLSMAVVDMIGDTTKTTNSTDQCPDTGGEESFSFATYEQEEEETTGEFSWNQNERGLILGSYYYGYTAMQIPSAWVAAKFGFRRAFGYSMLISSVITCIFPVLVRTDLYLGVAARVLLGVFHAVSFPALSGAWGAWAPPLERTKLNGISVSGASAGTCIIFSLAGGFIEWLGWDSIFYLTGALSVLWCISWFYLVYDTPDQHPRISAEEREYINSSIGQHGYRQDSKTPWRAILLSPPVWGLVLGHAASNWGNYTLNQQLPTYLSNVLRFDLKLTGILSSMCYVLQWLVCVVASWGTDWIRSKNVISTLRIRKINTIIGLWVTGICVVLAGYAGCNGVLAVILFLISAGLNTFTVPGCKSSMLDIAPAYSGIVFGVSNTVSNIPGFVAPQLVGLILQDSTRTEWRTVFWVSAGVHFAGSLLYLIKGSDQLQSWAKHEEEKKGSKELEKQS